MREPLKVRISPKAMRTLWCISAKGGEINPAASNAQPKLHITVAMMSCKRFMIAYAMLSLHLFQTKAHRVLYSLCCANSSRSWVMYCALIKR